MRPLSLIQPRVRNGSSPDRDTWIDTTQHYDLQLNELTQRSTINSPKGVIGFDKTARLTHVGLAWL